MKSIAMVAAVIALLLATAVLALLASTFSVLVLGEPFSQLAGAMSVSFSVLFLVPVLALAALAGMTVTVTLNRPALLV